MLGSRRLLAAGGPGLTRRARTVGTRARLHDTIICRNRLRRLVGYPRDEGSPPR